MPIATVKSLPAVHPRPTPKGCGRDAPKAGIDLATLTAAEALIAAKAFDPEIFFKERACGVNQATRIAIASRIASLPGSTISQEITHYRIRSERARVKIAMLSSQSNPGATAKLLQNYRISRESARADIAILCLQQKPNTVINQLPNLNLSNPAELARFFEAAASLDGLATSMAISRSRITDQSVLTRIATKAISENIFAIGELGNYGLSPANKNAAVQDALTLLGAATTPEEMVQKWRSLKIRILDRSQQDYPPTGIEDRICPDWFEAEPPERVAAIARWVQEHLHLDSSVLDYEADLNSQELGAAALAATLVSWCSIHPAIGQSRARLALSALSGYNVPEGRLSSHGARALYGTIFTAIELIGARPADEYSLDLCANRPQALALLGLAATIKGLGAQIPPQAYTGDYQQRVAALHHSVDEHCARILEREGIAPAQIRALREEWGEVSTVATLAARLSKRAEWQPELPALASVVRNVAAGTFYTKRYSTADGQLSFLSEQELAAWQRNPIALKLYDSPATPSAAVPSRAVASVIFLGDIEPHIPATPHTEPKPTSEDLRRILTLSESDRSKALRSFSRVGALLSLALRSSEITQGELKALLAAVNNNKAQFLLEITDEKLRKKLSSQFQSLKDAISSHGIPTTDPTYVLSVISDHPLLLMRIGELVQTASCQHYRIGEHIDSLLGYVLDGNIKVALSFLVNKQRLDTVTAGFTGALHFSFDPTSMALHVRGLKEDTPEDARLELGYALQRRVLRLGVSNANTVLIGEEAYHQSHPLSAIINADQDKLIDSVRSSIGAARPRIGQTVVFPASRNPGGVTSDLCGGRLRGPYSHTFSDESWTECTISPVPIATR